MEMKITKGMLGNENGENTLVADTKTIPKLNTTKFKSLLTKGILGNAKVKNTIVADAKNTAKLNTTKFKSLLTKGILGNAKVKNTIVADAKNTTKLNTTKFKSLLTNEIRTYSKSIKNIPYLKPTVHTSLVTNIIHEIIKEDYRGELKTPQLNSVDVRTPIKEDTHTTNNIAEYTVNITAVNITMYNELVKEILDDKMNTSYTNQNILPTSKEIRFIKILREAGIHRDGNRNDTLVVDKKKTKIDVVHFLRLFLKYIKENEERGK